MNTKTRVLAASLLFTLLPQVVALPARAQGDTDPVTAQARARFKEGVDFYDKGQYENARLAFLQAYALKKHPAVLLNLAQSSAKSNHPLEAARYFQQFLREASNVSPQQQKDAEAGLAEVRQKLGRIEVIAPAGTEITIDDTKVGSAPLPEPVDVEPGPHTVRSPTDSVKVIATVGQKTQANLGASTAATPAAPVPATPSTTSPTPETEPAAPTSEPPPASYGVDTHSSRNRDLLAPPRSMGPVYGGLAVAGIGIAGTIVFAAFKADAQSKADTVANEIRSAASSSRIEPAGICARQDPSIQTRFGSACQTLRDNNDKVDTNATIANVSAVIAGVGLLTAAGWYLFAPKRDEPAPAPAAKRREPSRPVFSPYAGYGSGGFVLSGEL